MNSVIKGAGYILAHTPDLVLHAGTTQTIEGVLNSDSEYLKELPRHLRSYEEALSYWPNQVYIGNAHPEELRKIPLPWQDKKKPDAARFGKYGEIMPEEEFFLLMQASDAFDVVELEKGFVCRTRKRLAADPAIFPEFLERIRDGLSQEEIDGLVKDGHAKGLYVQGKLVGAVKSAHEIDENLSASVLLENLASKASCALAILHAIKNSGIDKSEVQYVLECSEEACGDMNQRGGGNFAKSAAETAGLFFATGSDVRAFCAAPVHACIEAASLVQAGVFATVVVAAGGCSAKLGMNGKEHVKRGLPVLEDCLGGFALVICKNDRMNPEIDLGIVGRHMVGTGSAPQAVMESLVSNPLARAGMKIKEIDKYAPEMQNPDITKHAGAGDVPLANYKMIGALAVKRGELERKDLTDFTEKHGLPGWAPTQGHIPSGVPYIGFAREDILLGKIKNAMIIGKGSLFLGRMTNLFDGVSFVIHANTAKEERTQKENSAPKPRIAIAGLSSELGEEVVFKGALAAAKEGVDVLYIGTLSAEGITTISASGPEEGHRILQDLLEKSRADAVVTMHYTFPIGLSTVGRSLTPARGRQMYIATTTGSSARDRVYAMVRNAICGIAAAKACGIEKPKVGILNVEGARKAKSALKTLQENGYSIAFAKSLRADKGCIMRGNDVLMGSCDVLVCDSLSGNILSKMLSSFTTGGDYESLGDGYGPGLGEDFGKPVLIVSRASGAPVIEGAIRYAAQLVRGDLSVAVAKEFASAKKAGLQELFKSRTEEAVSTKDQTASPAKEPLTEEILGIEITDLDEGVKLLLGQGIYADSGMGCTGPVILVSKKNKEWARQVLIKAGLISPE